MCDWFNNCSTIFYQGGKEHGVPIIISEIHDDMPAQRCQDLYVGDAILSVNATDLKDATHAQAVHVLSRVHGDITMEVLYVDVDESADEDNWEEDTEQRFASIVFRSLPFASIIFRSLFKNNIRDLFLVYYFFSTQYLVEAAKML